MATNTETQIRTVRPYAEIVQEALLTSEHNLRRHRDHERLRAFYLGQRHAHADTYEMLTGVPSYNIERALDALDHRYVESLCWLPSLDDAVSR